MWQCIELSKSWTSVKVQDDTMCFFGKQKQLEDGVRILVDFYLIIVWFNLNPIHPPSSLSFSPHTLQQVFVNGLHAQAQLEQEAKTGVDSLPASLL